jgi:hypothetical protein
MRLQVPGLLIAAALTYVTAAPAWQDPPGGRRPGPPPGRGEQDPGRPPRPEDDEDGPPPPPFGPPPNPMFMAIDTDDDGELSPKEIANAAKSLLKLDRNKDGILTEDEVRPPPPPGGRRGGPGNPPPRGGAGAQGADARAMVESVMKFDKDGDGKISAKELPARMARLLEEGDANKDGSLDQSEVETLSRRPPPRRQGPPAGGPPGSPPGGPPDEDGPPPPPPDDEDHGRPVEAVAKELGVTPEKFREVFKKVRPAGPGQRPTEAQRIRNRKILSEGLGVSPEKLDEVMDKYRPGGKVQDGSPR